MRISTMIVAAAALAVATGGGLAVPSSAKGTPPHPPGRELPAHDATTLLVKMKPGSAKLRAPGLASTRRFRVPSELSGHDIARWRVVTVRGGQDLRKVRENLLRNPNVEQVELNYLVSADLIPDDPQFGSLWGLNNTGQTGGVADADIDAPEAWDLAGTGAQTLVAVIDTGIDYTHPDLAANVWTNPGEIPGNGIDDDGNGYVDDIHGYDFAYSDADPMDGHGHGTHVSGTIAAVGDNGIGVAGVTWNSRLMALKFLDDSGSGSTTDAIDAVLYATAMGAQISNNSWGGGSYSQALYDAISAAGEAGSLFVAAAGNSSSDNDLTPHYPSSYDLPNVVAVASTDAFDNLSSFSCYGATSVDLAAPGSDIVSTLPGATYGTYSGTSMATPHVAGAAALVLSANPGISPQTLRMRLMGTVNPLPALEGKMVSGGRLNLLNALENDALAPATVQDLNVAGSDAFSLDLTWTASGDDGTAGQASLYRIHWATQPFDAATLDLTDSAIHTAVVPAGSLESATLTGLAPSTDYYVGIVAVDNVGNASGLSPLVVGSTAEQHTGFSDDFENGLGNWTIEGTDGLGGPALWHISEHRAASPTSALYYGVEATLTYDTGATNQGTATSVPFLIPAEGILSFRHYAQTESLASFDEMKVDISVAGGAWENLLTRYNTTTGMETEQIDLSAHAGQEARIRFSFDTKDGVSNNLEGWVIDDVSVAAPEPPETIAPAPIQDLSASLVEGAVVLDWTASGDDDLTGIAAKYDLRFMTAPIDAANFDLAMPVEGVPAPSAAGTPESFTMPLGLLAPSTEYWFALRAVDDWGNAGEVVNAAQVTTGPETIVTVLSEGFDTGAAGWTMEGAPGLWHISAHRYLSPSSALYYGIEDTLTFDTGTPNSGTATSPAIDLTDKSYARLRFSDYRQAETGGYDVSLVQVAPAGGTVWTTIWEADYVSEPDTMTEHTVDLSSYDGTVIQVRFSFDTVDAVGNATEGWVIDDFQVEALSANLMPVPVLSGPADRVMPGQLVTFDASQSYDPEGAPLSYSWTVDGIPLPGAENWLEYTFESGYHLVNLTVSDGIDSQSASRIVQVNTPPTAVLPGPATTVIGQDTLFDAAGSYDADGDTLTFSWSVASVPVGTGPTLLYNFGSIGQYLVGVEVSDGYVTSRTDLLVQVNENSAPTALISGPVSGTRIGALSFDGSGSSDVDGQPLTYAWTVDGIAAGTGATLTHTFGSLGLHQVGLTVSDGIAASSTTHEVSIENLAPTAEITGPASGTRVEVLVFDASTSSDPESDPLTYAWTIDGAAAGTGTTLTHTFGEIGVYQIELTVSDGLASHSVAHEVTIANAAPTAAIAAPTSGTRLDALVFDASGSTDPEGESLSYSWSVDGIAAGTGPTLTRTFSELGVYQVAVTVSDGTDSATATHAVSIENLAPTASITGPASGTRLDALVFQADASDAEGDALSYSWSVDGAATGTGAILTHTFDSVGGHQVGLTVSDGFETVNTTVEVTIGNLAPAADITGPTTGTRLDTLAFQASGSDPEGDPLTYAWSIDGTAAGTGSSLSHTFDSIGEHQVALTLSDGFDSTTVSHSVVIENLVPTAAITGPAAGNRIDSLSFSGTDSSDPEGDPLTYSWMIDGAPAGTGPILSMTFNSLGIHQVVLTVSDGIDTHTVSHSVVIENIAPMVDAGANQSVFTRDPVTLNGTAWDQDGTIVGTSWQQTSGTPVDLVVSGLTATFEAPKLTTEKQTTLTFELTATDELGATTTDLVTVYVNK